VSDQAREAALALVQHWVHDLRLGSSIDDEGWAEIRTTLDQLPADVWDEVHVVLLDILAELDHDRK